MQADAGQRSLAADLQTFFVADGLQPLRPSKESILASICDFGSAVPGLVVGSSIRDWMVPSKIPPSSVGLLARTISDLELLFPIIAGPDGIDPAIAPVNLGDPSKGKVNGLRIAVYSENGSAFPTDDTKATVEIAAKALETLGAIITSKCSAPAKQTPKLQRLALVTGINTTFWW
mgnify:FL=1